MFTFWRRTRTRLLSPTLIARVSLPVLMYSVQAVSQDFAPTLAISPASPKITDSIAVTLNRPLGGCRAGPRLFSLERNRQTLTIVHVIDLNLPVPLGSCAEFYDFGKLAGGTYQLVWKELGLPPLQLESTIATFAFAVSGASATEVPTLSCGGLAALTVVLGTMLSVAASRVKRTWKWMNWWYCS